MRVTCIIKYKIALLVNIINEGERMPDRKKLTLVKAVESRKEEVLKIGVDGEPIEDISDLFGDIINRNQAVKDKLAAERLQANKGVLRSYRIKN